MENFESLQSLFGRIHTEAEDRRLKGEDKDPVMAMDEAVSQQENVSDIEAEIILRAHENGPWAITNEEELSIFSKWCERAGSPLSVSGDIEKVNGIGIYMNDFGDCVLAESAKGNDFAIWTRKGRLQIGFRNEVDAEVFRSKDPIFSIEATGNKRIGLIVLEGGDTEAMKEKVTSILK